MQLQFLLKTAKMEVIILVFLTFLQISEKYGLGIPEYENDPGNATIPSYPDYADNVPVSSNSGLSTEATTISPIKDCECAVFSRPFPAKRDTPILVQVPNYVDCKFDGEEDCISLCSILAKAAKKNGPEIICHILGNYDRLSASIHSRVTCTSNSTWIYTGLTSSEKICCKEHRVVSCIELAESDVYVDKDYSLARDIPSD